MRGSLWTVTVAGIGGGLALRGAGQAFPASPATSTDSVGSVLNQLTPFLGELLAVAAIAWILIVAVRTDP